MRSFRRWALVLLGLAALTWYLWPTHPSIWILDDGSALARTATPAVVDLLDELGYRYVAADSISEDIDEDDVVLLLTGSEAEIDSEFSEDQALIVWNLQANTPTSIRIAPHQRTHPLFRGVPDSWQSELGPRGTLNSSSEESIAVLLRRDAENTSTVLRLLETPRRVNANLPLNASRDPNTTVLANAIAWSSGREIPAGGVLGDKPQTGWVGYTIPPAPPCTIPHDAIALFDGQRMSAWGTPSADGLQSVDRRTQWGRDIGSLVPRAGGPDLWTLDEFESYWLHADVYIPVESPSLPEQWRGQSGIYLNDLYEIAISDSHDREPDLTSFGAISGQRAPLTQAALPAGQWQSLEIAFDQVRGEAPLVSVWVNRKQVQRQVALTEPTAGATAMASQQEPPAPPKIIEDPTLSFDREDLTVVSRFRASGDGTLFSRSPLEGDWKPNAKAVFLRGGKLVFDIGWVGAISGGGNLLDEEWHTAALVYRGKVAHLFVDGVPVHKRADFHSNDVADHVFKVGSASPNFGGDLEGDVEQVLYFDRALSDDEVAAYASGTIPADPPRLNWFDEGAQVRRKNPKGRIRLQNAGSEVRFANVYVQPLPSIDHAEYCAEFDEEQLKVGEELFRRLCITCHGDLKVKGSIPEARNFYSAKLENGSDPYRLFRTVSYGYKKMEGQSSLTLDERYAVVHYLREGILSEHNPNQYFRITDEYLDSLPQSRRAKTEPRKKGPGRRNDVYLTMNFGPSLNWTFEIEKGQIAYKGIAQRLDGSGRHSEGGVSKGKHWGIFDHDTMRMAAAWSGEFVDWKGIAFDGSHQTHTSIGTAAAFMNPVGPGWARPGTDDFEDPRFRGRDGKPYGPLPREWARYKGHYHSRGTTTVAYVVGDCDVHECLDVIERDGEAPIFVRSLSLGKSSTTQTLRIAPADLHVELLGSDSELTELDGFHVWSLPPHQDTLEASLLISTQPIADLGELDYSPKSPLSYTRGGARRWREKVTTEIVRDAQLDWPGALRGPQPYTVDEIVTPHENPYDCWMRLGGHDFFEGGDRAAVCTWLGDVWMVEGLTRSSGEVTWQRIASGLFQPLGVKVVDGDIFVTCRDQIVRLVDLDNDGCTDFYQNFNNDHQVTEHFHEFAMGLQTDAEGNFYYAKSARHALKALVPQHGTLIKVDRDGLRTTILANGFRAANGICLNPDGSFYVTDQEGHWMPKNRINRVTVGGYYGNAYGYHDRGDSDEAMEPPLCWLTNEHDRSPAELLWAQSDRWGPLSDRLIQVSYGTGRLFAVLEQQVGETRQGGQVPLPLPVFPTGIMRGRFNPTDGQLYVSGMFAWAGNRQEPGGFYRVRHTGNELVLPIGYRAKTGALEFEFSAPLDREFFGRDAEFEVTAWDLRRSKNYGSPHLNERTLDITEQTLLDDGRTVRLAIPDLAPSWGMKTRFRVRSDKGTEAEDTIHHSIFALE